MIVPIGKQPNEAHTLVRETLGLEDLHAQAVKAAKAAGAGKSSWLKGW